MDKTIQPFSAALKAARKEKKLTQAELAEKVGISHMSVKRYESGDTLPDMDKLEALCFVLKNNKLVDSWTYSTAIIKAEKSAKTGKNTKTVGEALGETSEEDYTQNWGNYIARRGFYRRYWNQVLQKGTPSFMIALIDTALCYEQLDPQTVSHAVSVLQAFTKVPEYQAKTNWAFENDGIERELDESVIAQVIGHDEDESK